MSVTNRRAGKKARRKRQKPKLCSKYKLPKQSKDTYTVLSTALFVKLFLKQHANNFQKTTSKRYKVVIDNLIEFAIDTNQLEVYKW